MSSSKEYKIPDVFVPLYNAYIKPYGGCRFVDPGVFPAFRDLLDLLVAEGNCPSVVPKKYANDIAKALSMVSLLEHSLNVTENLADQHRRYYHHDLDFRLCVPVILFTGLGHDIAKIPQFVTSWQSRFQHSAVSSDIISDLLDKYNADPPWKFMVLKAIRHHHSAIGDDRLSAWLCKADREARERELWKATGSDLI
jgi:hypothetical protein